MAQRRVQYGQPRMILERVIAHATAASHRPALVLDSIECTYRELADMTQRLAAYLAGHVTPGAPIGVMMTAERESVAAILAAESVGSPVVLLAPTLTQPELRQYLQDSGAVLIVLPPASPHTGDVLARDAVRASIDGCAVAFLSPRRCTRLDPDAWIVQLTSGSLGPSRLAVRTGRGVALEVDAVADRIELNSDDTVLCASSLAHSYGLVGGLLAPLSRGATVITPDPRVGLGALASRTRPTVVLGLAGTYRHLLQGLQTGGLQPAALQRIRYTLCAGAPLPYTLFTEWRSTCGLAIRQDYGTTETGTICIDTSDTPGPDVAGIPLPHLDVELAPAMGAQGHEILVRSPTVALGYADAHGLRPTLDAEGWYRTGDAGYLDADGRLRLSGRIREPIGIGNAAVAPDEVEHHLRQISQIRDVAVLGVRDASGATQVKAVVVAPGLDPEDVRRLCDRYLPTELRPALVELRDTLPTSPAGKVLHKYLL